jgi:hypothetical protein
MSDLPQYFDLQCQTPIIPLGQVERLQMFVYQITTTDGFVARVTTDGDPTEHPAFYGRVLDVETIGEAGLHAV